MTKEEAISQLKLTSWAQRNQGNHYLADVLDMAIKALDILDKIRAEIINIPITDSDGHINNWYREPQAIINDVLRIIDKYKTGE